MKKEIQTLISDLMHQALHEVGNRISGCVYDFTPNSAGIVISRFNELCIANGLDPMTGEFITNNESEN